MIAIIKSKCHLTKYPTKGSPTIQMVFRERVITRGIWLVRMNVRLTAWSDECDSLIFILSVHLNQSKSKLNYLDISTHSLVKLNYHNIPYKNKYNHIINPMPEGKIIKRRTKLTVAKKFSPFQNCFANIKLLLRPIPGSKTTIRTLEENEFIFLLSKAVQTVHGEFANSIDVLKFKQVDELNYQSIIRFKTIHFSRIITSLLLFGHWDDKDFKFEIIKTAQTPCFLSI